MAQTKHINNITDHDSFISILEETYFYLPNIAIMFWQSKEETALQARSATSCQVESLKYQRWENSFSYCFFACCFNLEKPCGRVNSCFIYSTLWTKLLEAEVIIPCLPTPYGEVIESEMSSWWVGDRRGNLTFRLKIKPKQKYLQSSGFLLPRLHKSPLMSTV